MGAMAFFGKGGVILGAAGALCWHSSAFAFADPSKACSALVEQAKRAGADPGYKCVAHPARRVLFAWHALGSKKVSEASWASVKGFAAASAAGKPEGWDMVFEASGGKCMALSESSAKTLWGKYGAAPGAIDSKAFIDEASGAIKPSACDLRPFKKAELPPKGGKLCELLDAAAKPSGGLSAAFASCRQQGDSLHIEMKPNASLVAYPRNHYAVLMAAGLASKALPPGVRLSLPLDNGRNPTRCLSVPAAAFEPVSRLSERELALAQAAPPGVRLTDLPPSSLGSALLAPIERMQLEPELGGSQPCLGYGAIEVVYTQILGRSSPAQK